MSLHGEMTHILARGWPSHGIPAGAREVQQGVSSQHEGRSRFRTFSFAVLTIISAAEMSLNFARLYSDSGFYIQLGRTGFSPYTFVSVRFLLPFFAVALNRALPALGIAACFGMVNLVFWAGGVVVAFYLGRIFLGDVGAFLCGLFFTTSVATLSFGAAVVSDPAGYFFVGLAVLLALLTRKKMAVKRTAVEGAALSLGGFFHPSGFFGLLFTIAYRIWKRQGVVGTLLGTSMLLVGLIVAYFRGWLADIPHASTLFTNAGSHLLQPHLGPALPDALVWTFGVSAPVLGLVHVAYGLMVLQLPIWPLGLLRWCWFVLVLCIGFSKSIRKGALSGCLVSLSIYPFIAPTFIERYLFVVWPFFVPVLVRGIQELARFPALLVVRIAGESRQTKLGALSNPNLYAAIFLLLQGLSNNLAIASALGISPILR